MFFRFYKEVGNEEECYDRRGIFGDENSETLKQHKQSQKENGVHGAIFQIDVTFNSPDVTDGNLSDDHCAQAVAKEDKRDGKREGECSNDSIN